MTEPQPDPENRPPPASTMSGPDPSEGPLSAQEVIERRNSWVTEASSCLVCRERVPQDQVYCRAHGGSRR